MIDFSALFMAWPSGIILLNQQDEILFINEKAIAITGYSADQLQGSLVYQWFQGDGNSFREEFATGKISYLLEHADVSIPQWWLVSNGEFKEVEARSSQLDLPQGRFKLISFEEFEDPEQSLFFIRKLAAFATLSPQPVAQVGLDGSLEYSNECLNDLMLEFGFDDFGHAHVFPKKWQELVEKCLAKKSEVQVEHEISGHWYQWTFHPVFDQSIPFVLLIATDITAHVKHKKSLESINRLQLQNNKQKTEYMATLYSEMQTPLMEIQTHAELLNRQSLIDQESEWVRNIFVASKVLKGLVDDSEDRIHIENNNFEIRNRIFNPRQIVVQTLEMLSPKISAKALNYYLWINPRAPKKINGDAKRLGQVLRVLLNNAIDYTERGAIVVQLQIRTMAKREWLRVAVTDSGQGMSQKKIGTLFSSTANAGHALAYTKQVVSLMGGQIGVQSVEGRGSSFFIDFPNDGEETAAPVFSRPPRVAVQIEDGIWKNTIEQYLDYAAVTPVIIEDAELFIGDQTPNPDVAHNLYLGQGRPKDHWDYILSGHASPTLLYDILQSVINDEHKTVNELEKISQQNSVDREPLNLSVLLVDDNPNNLTVFAEIIRLLGCTVVTADSAEEAITQWFISGGTIQMILLDCKMPNMDGYQCAEKLRDENYEGPIIGLTNRRWQDELDDVIRAGMTTCTTKPLDVDEIFNLMLDLI